MAIFFEELLKLNLDKKFYLSKYNSREIKSRVLKDFCSVSFYDKHIIDCTLHLFAIESDYMKKLLVSNKQKEYQVDLERAIKMKLFTKKEYAENVKRIMNDIYPKYQHFISECNKEIDRYFGFEIDDNIEIFDRNGREYMFKINGLEKISFSAIIENDSLSTISAMVNHDLADHFYVLNPSLKLKRNQEILNHILTYAK